MGFPYFQRLDLVRNGWNFNFQQSNPLLLPPWQRTQLVQGLNLIKVWGVRIHLQAKPSKVKDLMERVTQTILSHSFADAALNPNDGFSIGENKNSNPVKENQITRDQQPYNQCVFIDQRIILLQGSSRDP